MSLSLCVSLSLSPLLPSSICSRMFRVLQVQIRICSVGPRKLMAGNCNLQHCMLPCSRYVKNPQRLVFLQPRSLIALSIIKSDWANKDGFWLCGNKCVGYVIRRGTIPTSLGIVFVKEKNVLALSRILSISSNCALKWFWKNGHCQTSEVSGWAGCIIDSSLSISLYVYSDLQVGQGHHSDGVTSHCILGNVLYMAWWS